MIFPVHFLICNIVISFFLFVMLLLKKGLKRHLTVRIQYDLWYIFVFMLMLPFIPFHILTPEKQLLQIQQWLTNNSGHSTSVLTNISSDLPPASDFGMTDFSMAIASSNPHVYTVLWITWITGMILVALFFISQVAKLYWLRKQAYPITNHTESELYHLYDTCLKELRIKQHVRLYASCRLASPISYGLFRPTVIIPQDLDILMTNEDIRFVFLHELQHYKRKDTILNYLVCFLQIIYWFNPFIWYGFHQLRKDREIACDNAVVHVIGKEQSKNYGYTLIKYTKQMQKGMFIAPLSNMGGNKHTIKQRIQEIADYKKDSTRQKIKSAGVMILSLVLVYCSSPLLVNTFSVDNSSNDLKDKNSKTIDVSPYFHGIHGSFVLYDMTKDQYQIYNRQDSEQRVSPDSTFKIYSGLFALEENIITTNDSSQAWDGEKQPYNTWNQDQTLETAMKNSVNWYFQNLDYQLGIAKLYDYYHKISYGNCDLTGGINQYWAESSLKISPIEQTQLLSDLLQNKWDFQTENIKAIQHALYLSDIPAGKLYGKTGTGIVNGKNTNGWFVGFIEQNGHFYCFATNLQDSDSANGSTAMQITIDILNHIL
ncbi:MAG: BlaR1 family beta-lactam sensor/signal transducer [Lachnospiraceae bacterium]|nr:BlaR1 family beta-lactam sensor/signal transducer [Lachnospiraceae bacterium]